MPVPNLSNLSQILNGNPNAAQNPSTSIMSQFGYAYGPDTLAVEAPEKGPKSLANNYTIFVLSQTGGDANNLLVTTSNQGITPVPGNFANNPSASTIINWANENVSGYTSFGSTPYSWVDFLYCKFYGKIPNNYLITLRRYPIPMYDNLKTVSNTTVPPVAQAVTWAGEETGNKLNEFFKFSFGLNWHELEASVHNVEGNEQGHSADPWHGIDKVGLGKALEAYTGLTNPNQFSGQKEAETRWAENQYGSEGAYWNKIYGPVNVVNKTYARDRGLHFSQDLSLKFHYSLRYLGSINPKAALLDILSNMLTLTYNNAKFWGGAIRYFPHYPNVPFLGDQKKLWSGDVGGYIDSTFSAFSSMGDNIINSLQSALSNPLEALKNLAGNGLKAFFAGHAAKNRPTMLSFASLLSGAPVGEWHMVIGNPMNPIAMIGNLIVDDVELEFNDELGPDDFPTEMTFTVKLKHGKPRDKGDIESMFNLGNGRLYYGIDDAKIFSSTQNSQTGVNDHVANQGNNASKSKSGSIIQTVQDINTANTNFQNGAGAHGSSSMWGNKFDIATNSTVSPIIELLRQN